MSEERKTIYLCLAHMSEEGWEQKYVKEAFDTNWVVPMVRSKQRVVKLASRVMSRRLN